ncbi:EAL domain-containing protein [Marinospirillum sp.]|uniref:EAL domain-containing protein n=1 Tax=Marinospirillum sp. TaxID=2183934 RepID=UPI003A86C625
MRRHWIWLIPLLFLAGLLLIALLFQQNRSVYQQQYQFAVQLFNQLRELDAVSDREIVQIAHARGRNYDHLAQARQQIYLAQQALEQWAELDDPVTQTLLSTYFTLQEHKEALVLDIQHYAALSRNGLLYLPQLNAELSAQGVIGEAQRYQLLSALYRFHLFGDLASLHEVQRHLADLQALPVTSAALADFNHHAERNLSHLARLSQDVQAYLLIESRPVLDALEQQKQIYYAERVALLERRARIMVGLTLLLVLGLALAGYRWQLSSQQSRLARQRLETAVSGLSEAFALFDGQGRLVLCNQAWQRTYPWMNEQERRDWSRCYASLQRYLKTSGCRADLKPQEVHQFLEETYDGRWLQASDSGTPEGGRVCVRTDISGIQQSRQELRTVAAVFENCNEAIMVVDAAVRIALVNPAFERITGYAAAEVLGQNPHLLASGRHDRAFYRQLWLALLEDGQWSGEIWNRRRNGEIYPQHLSITTLRNAADQVHEYVAVFTDITQHKKHEEQIKRQAYYDALTQLPNRILLIDRLEQALAQPQRHRLLALCFIDLDRFKNVNDTLGHEAGDQLLVQVAARFTACLPASATLARFGGDEYVVLLPELHSAQEATLIAEQMIACASEPFVLAERDIQIGCSIGIALYPNDARDADSLMRNADLAMYQAKQAGRNCLRFFTQRLQREADHLMQLEQDLRLALAAGQFSVHYQPQISTQTGQIEGVEALLRWQHPQRGWIPPADFIGLAEDTGLIGELGWWVLEQSLSDLAGWKQQGYALHLAVNVSGRQKQLGLQAESVLNLLARLGLQASDLVIEITESLLMERDDDTQAWLEAFTSRGIQLAIDDFGTGYSSLSYLKRFPISVLKIDREFIRDLGEAGEAQSLVEAIVALGRSLGLKLVAEGVETAAQLSRVQALGCDQVQGYYYARPLPSDQLLLWCDAHQVEGVAGAIQSDGKSLSSLD